MLRLRSAGPIRTLVRRDLLGYRRSPTSVMSGLVLVVLGIGGIGSALDRPGLPILLALLAAATTYLGCGAWCEGLRLQADTAGAPALLGTAPRRQALAHLLAPLGLALFVSVPTALGVTLLVTTPGVDETLGRVAAGCGGALIVVLLSLAGQAWAAFRGSMPAELATQGAGPALTAAWYAVPMLTVAVTAGILTDQLAGGALWWPFPAGVVGVAVFTLMAVTGVDRESDAQRA